MKWIAVPKPHSSATQSSFVIQRKKPTLISLATLLLATVVGFSAEKAIIQIDAAKGGAAISPRLYGIFLEEINHGVDGGLYAELIRNRAFEDARPPEGYSFRSNRWRDARGADAGFAK